MILLKLNALIAQKNLDKIVLRAIKPDAKCACKGSFTMKMVTITMLKADLRRLKKGEQNVFMTTAQLGSVETWN
jgi:hypothetical protein